MSFKLCILIMFSMFNSLLHAEEAQESEQFKKITALNKKLAEVSELAFFKVRDSNGTFPSGDISVPGLSRLETELFKKFTTSTGESTSLAERWALLSNICQKNDISLHVKIDDQVGVVVATSKNSKFIEIVLPDYIQEEETFTPKEETEFRHLHAVLNRVFRFAISAARGLKSSGYYSHISAKTKFFTYSRSNDFDMVLKKLLNISELGISRNDHIEIDLTYFTGKSVGNYAYIHLIPRDSGKNEVLVRLFLDFSDSVDQSELDVAFFGNVDQVEKFARSGEFIETSR